jgi:HSP20 family protein
MLLRRMFDMPRWGAYTSPFEEMERSQRELERLRRIWEGGPFRREVAGVFPLINLTEDKEKYYLRAELPGIRGEDLDIQAMGNSLTISGERKIPAEAENVKYHRRERDAGRFSRIINMPGDIDSEKVEANLKDGILKVIVPKAEKAKPRQITVR